MCFGIKKLFYHVTIVLKVSTKASPSIIEDQLSDQSNTEKASSKQQSDTKNDVRSGSSFVTLSALHRRRTKSLGSSEMLSALALASLNRSELNNRERHVDFENNSQSYNQIEREFFFFQVDNNLVESLIQVLVI